MISRTDMGPEGSAGVPPATNDEPLRGRDAHAPVQFLNVYQEIDTHRHHLPHWQQGQAWQFVTWRLADSLPQIRLEEWKTEREAWLLRHPKPWDQTTELDYHKRFSHRVDEWLDAGSGSCVLREPAMARIVADSLRHFDGQRYLLGPFVVMPNHLHVLFQPYEGHALARIIHTWKSFTAKEINRASRRTGRLWQEDYWDRLIRHESHWHACRHYIVRNPAHLRPGTFLLGEGSAGVPPATNDEPLRGRDARPSLHE